MSLGRRGRQRVGRPRLHLRRSEGVIGHVSNVFEQQPRDGKFALVGVQLRSGSFSRATASSATARRLRFTAGSRRPPESSCGERHQIKLEIVEPVQHIIHGFRRFAPRRARHIAHRRRYPLSVRTRPPGRWSLASIRITCLPASRSRYAAARPARPRPHHKNRLGRTRGRGARLHRHG